MASNDRVQAIKEAGFVELMVMLDCGELAWLACLCDPDIREAHRILSEKLTLREASALYKRLCGCEVVQQTPVQPTGATIPVSFPVPPAPPPPAPPPPAAPPAQPPPVEQPPPPAEDCTIIPPEGSHT